MLKLLAVAHLAGSACSCQRLTRRSRTPYFPRLLYTCDSWFQRLNLRLEKGSVAISGFCSACARLTHCRCCNGQDLVTLHSGRPKR